MKEKTKPQSKGMTLLEVLIALMLLCVGIMAVAAMLNIALQSNARAQSGVQDTIAGAVLMEQMLALPYDDPGLEDGDDGFHPDNPDHGPFDTDRISTTVEWEVDDEFPVPNAKRVLVIVRRKGDRDPSGGYRFDYVKTRDLRFPSADAEAD